MGGLLIEVCILVIHGEFIDGSCLYEIFPKSNLSIIGTQNFLTCSHGKTTRYCIEVATSAIYFKLIDAHRRSSSDLESINDWKKCLKLGPCATIVK